MVVQDRPVKDEIVLVALAEEEVLQQSPHVSIVRTVLEAQTATVVQIGDKLAGEVLAENLNRRGHLLLHDLLVLLLLGVCLQALPGQAPPVEVHQHITHGLQVIATALLNTQVGIDAGIPGGACQVLVLAVRYVLLRLGVSILLCKTKVDDVHLVCLLSEANQEVVRLDITMNEVLCVHIFHPVNHLVRKHQHRLEAEFAVAEAEQVLQGWPKQVNDHDVVVALNPIPVNIGNSNTACEDLVELRLVKQLRVLGLDRLELDGNLLTRLHVGAYVNVAE
mmetsp:Transcript_39474/g.118192  ORF Transcript_39474/g.118192 Transcript_39474/m.118192 type:complete len:278 (+) Transcript_39474:153-986(+)